MLICEVNCEFVIYSPFFDKMDFQEMEKVLTSRLVFVISIRNVSVSDVKSISLGTLHIEYRKKLVSSLVSLTVLST